VILNERVFSNTPTEGAVRIRRADLRSALAKVKESLTEVDRAADDEEMLERSRY
jgi:uncharacterized protein (UPF0212 family)